MTTTPSNNATITTTRERLVAFGVAVLLVFSSVSSRQWLGQYVGDTQRFWTTVSDTIQPLTGILETTSTSVSDNDYYDDDDEAALQFVLQRRQAYQEAGHLARFSFRGIGYLFTHHGLVLEARLRGLEETTTNHDSNVTQLPTIPLTQTVVEIRQVPHKNQVPLVSADCDKLYIWVRVAGPEIFAGKAVAVESSSQEKNCHWEFELE